MAGGVGLPAVAVTDAAVEDNVELVGGDAETAGWAGLDVATEDGELGLGVEAVAADVTLG